MVLDREEELSQGDILMIVKNNYYWMEEERKKIKEKDNQVPSNDIPAFLAV